jgi:hypothetical protein
VPWCDVRHRIYKPDVVALMSEDLVERIKQRMMERIGMASTFSELGESDYEVLACDAVAVMNGEPSIIRGKVTLQPFGYAVPVKEGDESLPMCDPVEVEMVDGRVRITFGPFESAMVPTYLIINGKRKVRLSCTPKVIKKGDSMRVDAMIESEDML